MSVQLKPKTGNEITLHDLRELIEKTKGMPGQSLVVVTANKRSTKINLVDIEIAD
ncbi:hypothetical protein [Streptomyces sp. NPDC048496]|uniref:hypothetical protein n=1 Tax=Streptomyces sp. NPDC048496 TaxID=3365558 RepID=UPI00371F2EAC